VLVAVLAAAPAFTKHPSVVMGPRLRGDDTVLHPCHYLMVLVGAAPVA
jgi:hypothetical protein